MCGANKVISTTINIVVLSLQLGWCMQLKKVKMQTYFMK